MNAPGLLAMLAARGAAARCEADESGAPVLVVTPGSAVADLLPDLQRFKPQLLELLTSPSPPRPAPGADDGPPEPPPHPLAVWDSAAGVWRRSDGAGRFPTLATLAAYAVEPENQKGEIT